MALKLTSSYSRTFSNGFPIIQTNYTPVIIVITNQLTHLSSVWHGSNNPFVYISEWQTEMDTTRGIPTAKTARVISHCMRAASTRRCGSWGVKISCLRVPRGGWWLVGGDGARSRVWPASGGWVGNYAVHLQDNNYRLCCVMENTEIWLADTRNKVTFMFA